MNNVLTFGDVTSSAKFTIVLTFQSCFSIEFRIVLTFGVVPVLNLGLYLLSELFQQLCSRPGISVLQVIVGSGSHQNNQLLAARLQVHSTVSDRTTWELRPHFESGLSLLVVGIKD